MLLANASFASACYRPPRRYGTYDRGSPWAGRDLPRFGVGLCPPDVPQVFRPFLGRLIFPIHTTGGQVAGFAGRSLTPSEKGRKYVNSPDSPAYTRAYPLRPAQGGEGRSLRGANPALRGIQGRARLPRLRHTVRRGAMRHGAHRGAYPGDTEAGRAGDALSRSRSGGTQNTVRCAHMLLSEGCAVSLLPLPDGMDPDEVYRRKGSDELARLAREVPRLPLLPHPPSGFPPSHGHRRHQRALGEIGLLSSPLAVYRRIGELSGATGIPIEVLRQEISVATGPKNVPVPVPKKEAAGLTPALPRERTLLRFCLTHHDRMFYDPDGNGISLPHGSPANWRTTSFP